MMDIRFRAWDVKNKKWIIDYVLSPHSGTVLCAGKSANLSYGSVHDTTIEITQFTGLEDKNGKDIYEGDILNFVFDSVIFVKNPYYVVFENGAFVIHKPNFHPLVSDCKHIEVIGNIYEHPELMPNNY